MTLDPARTVADAVLYEGYLLYPYRASSGKNHQRWQFGVVAPAAATAEGVGEGSFLQTECVLEAGAAASVGVRLRFLQVQSRSIERVVGDGFVPVPELRCGQRSWLSWDEAVEHEIDLGEAPVAELLEHPSSLPVEVAGGQDAAEVLTGDDGAVIGRLQRRRWPVSGRLQLDASQLAAPAPAVKLRVRLDNHTRWPAGGDRDAAVRRSFVAAHLLLSVRGGDFVSLLDPPEWAHSVVADCANHRCWPVLAGADGQRDVVLASPIILYDWPAVAAESPGQWFDSTEIDEMLTLRVMTLTAEERRQARATDPRAAAILDRCDGMTARDMQRLHGASREVAAAERAASADSLPAGSRPGAFELASRMADGSDPAPPWSPPEPGVPWWDPAADASVSPGTDSITVKGVSVAKGSTVLLRPCRRADAHDLFFAEQPATVAGVHHDVDGNVHVAVVLNDDPARDLHESYGRYLYFGPEELEPLEVRP